LIKKKRGGNELPPPGAHIPSTVICSTSGTGIPEIV